MGSILDSHNDINITHLYKNIGRQLRITPCCRNNSPGVLTSDTPYHLSGLPVTNTRYGASIDDIHISVFIFFCHLIPVSDKQTSHGITVILVDFTAKSDKRYFFPV